MRMEGKNAYFKSAARRSNFKNVAYSVARRHQRLLCGYLQSDTFFDYALESGPGVGLAYHTCNLTLLFVAMHFFHISS